MASVGSCYFAIELLRVSSKKSHDYEVENIFKNTEIAKYELLAQRELLELVPCNEVTDVTAKNLPVSNEEINKYDWEQITEENSLLIGGEPGSAKTSVTAGFIVPKISQKYDSEIIVLDSHSTKNRWNEMGYERVISDYEEIYEFLEWLDKEREIRRKSTDKKHLIICVFDEINDVWSYLERSDKQNKTKRLVNAQLILQNLLNCRKFDIQIIGMMQSHLCEDIGLSGSVRRQAMVILLNGAARAEAYRNKNQFTKEEYTYLTDKERPYIALVTGYQLIQIAKHPTHGNYKVFSKKGNKPEIVLSIKQRDKLVTTNNENTEDFKNNIIITDRGRFDLNKYSDTEVTDKESVTDNESNNQSDVTRLESLYNKNDRLLLLDEIVPDNWVCCTPKTDNLTPEVTGLIVQLIQNKISKEKTINAVFGCCKNSKSKSWKAASYWYEEIKQSIGNK
ncbi:hypothetical protein VV11_002325 [Trichodesmium erythraeum 21-75]|nr:hypothetical protein [Trichodesmium erythraeum 21-75]